MLSKDKRLNLKTDFKWVASGKKIETKLLKLFVRVGENSAPRLGIALSGKSFKKAVDRNRVRRLTSYAFETVFSSLPAGINIVALPKAHIIEVKSQEVVLDLEKVLPIINETTNN